MDVIKALEEKYNKQELKRSNMFFKPYLAFEWIYNFNIKNFFTFYRMVEEKIRVKPPFTPF